MTTPEEPTTLSGLNHLAEPPDAHLACSGKHLELLHGHVRKLRVGQDFQSKPATVRTNGHLQASKRVRDYAQGCAYSGGLRGLHAS
jgi:hypothetical protein